MPEAKLQAIADEADFIVAGYAYSLRGGKVRVLNLEKPTSAAVLDLNGNMLETTMGDVELSLVSSYYLKNAEFLEDSNA